MSTKSVAIDGGCGNAPSWLQCLTGSHWTAMPETLLALLAYRIDGAAGSWEKGADARVDGVLY